MTIVAAIIAILAGFGQFGTLILPPTSNLKFMRADIAIRCLTEKPTSPQATDLVALLSGDQGYVNDLIEFLVRTPRAAADDVPYDLHWIHPKVKMHPDGKAYDLDWKHAANAVDEPLYNLVTGLKPSDDTILSDEISDERKWVAYSVNIQARNRKTSIPIPATYETDHILHLFAAFSDPPKRKQPELATLGDPTLPSQIPLQDQKRFLPLLQVEIEPHKPNESSQLTNLGVKIFADTGCWDSGL